MIMSAIVPGMPGSRCCHCPLTQPTVAADAMEVDEEEEVIATYEQQAQPENACADPIMDGETARVRLPSYSHPNK